MIPPVHIVSRHMESISNFAHRLSASHLGTMGRIVGDLLTIIGYFIFGVVIIISLFVIILPIKIFIFAVWEEIKENREIRKKKEKVGKSYRRIIMFNIPIILLTICEYCFIGFLLLLLWVILK